MSIELFDDHVRLRAPRRADVEAALAAVRASMAELSAWTSWCHEDYARTDVEQFLRKVEAERFEDTAHDFYIVDASGTHVLGGCGLYQIDRGAHRASLGYWVRTDTVGQGIATAAARRVARYGFEDLDLARIEIIAAVENVASQRVAIKAGAVREGILRNRLRLRGRQVDAVGFSLIPGDLAP